MHDYLYNWCYCLDFYQTASSFTHPCFNNITVSVNMVKRANNVLLLLLKYFGLHGPPERLLGTMLWELPSEIFWLKLCFTCAVLWVNIYPKSCKGSLENTRLWKNLTTIVLILLHSSIIKKPLVFLFSSFSLGELLSSWCLLMSKSFWRERKPL